MQKKDIFDSSKPLENLLNRIIYAYLNKGDLSQRPTAEVAALNVLKDAAAAQGIGWIDITIPHNTGSRKL